MHHPIFPRHDLVTPSVINSTDAPPSCFPPFPWPLPDFQNGFLPFCFPDYVLCPPIDVSSSIVFSPLRRGLYSPPMDYHHPSSIYQSPTVIKTWFPPPETADFNHGFFSTVPQLRPTEMQKFPYALPMNLNQKGGRKPLDDADLSPDERARREKRRARNKEAAARCRQRRLDLIQELTEKSETIMEENTAKEKQIHKMRIEMQEVLKIIQQHMHHLPEADIDLIRRVESLAMWKETEIKEENEEIPSPVPQKLVLLPNPSVQQIGRPTMLEFNMNKNVLQSPNQFAIPSFSLPSISDSPFPTLFVADNGYVINQTASGFHTE